MAMPQPGSSESGHQWCLAWFDGDPVALYDFSVVKFIGLVGKQPRVNVYITIDTYTIFDG
jgi:hypothetical protein